MAKWWSLLFCISLLRPYECSENWYFHRDKGSVILMFEEAEYITSIRHIKVENNTGTSCPDLDPKKLLPNDPDGARAIGGIHNKHDPVLRLLLSCEVVPTFRKGTCGDHSTTDLFVWQPDFGFYTHGTLSLFTWIHDHIAPLLHALMLANSTEAANRALIVYHHSHHHRHPHTHHTSLGGGRRALLNSLFGAGLYTLGSKEGTKMMPDDKCLKVRKLVFGSGKTFNLQDIALKRDTIRMLRDAGYRAAGVEPPPALAALNRAQIMHIIAPHQHKFLHHHHHHNHHFMNASLDNSFMMEKFRVLQSQFESKLHLKWQACCHVSDLVSKVDYQEKERTTSLKAFKEAVLTASQSTMFVASNTPGLVYCLWGPEGAGTLEFSPKGPHDAVHSWNLCGWALNGSYLKVSVPKPKGMKGESTLLDRAVNCSSTLLESSIRKVNPRNLLVEQCRSIPVEEDVTVLCSPRHSYESHRLNASLGDICRFKPDVTHFECPTKCTKTNMTYLCISDDTKEEVLPCRAAVVVKQVALASNSGQLLSAAHWNPISAAKGDRMEPEWHNGNIQVIPEHPKPYRRGAFKPVSKEKALRTGCYQTLATARINKAMWCPQGAGALTAG